MKCPKCGYISFDYNQVCPKCNKDITGEQERLNIPAFRPEPLSLLSALIGDADESQTDMRAGGDYSVDDGHEADLSFDDSGAFDSGEVSFDDAGAFNSDEISFDDSQELELDFETQDSGEFEGSGESEGMQEEESVADFDFDSATDGDEISLDKMIWAVARSAADLLTSADLKRVGVCAGEGCGWLFFDTSKNNSRRWCAMEDCGNRAKARRHYQRSQTQKKKGG